MFRTGFRLVAVLAALVAVGGLVGSASLAGAQPATPKAYIGLFGDNAVGVIDTSANRLTKTIPIPSGPHGMEPAHIPGTRRLAYIKQPPSKV